MAIPVPPTGQTNSFFPDLCSIYRPFGAASPTTTGVPCRLVPDLARGRAASAAGLDLRWTHRLDVGPGVDLRDGCTRTAGSDQVTFADGDEVRVTTAAGTTRYVVVWVEELPAEGGQSLKRAYLLRHSPPWA
jgi:hypothetical protein